ncbi:DUF6042 family protein [Nocardia sp. NRRL S-836]|uniref:DUF6042 family protein n=1 Tax=Nocardia sp. NRRL S-836 TaxID=1519492 RepID=UPI0021006B3C|nr:DUF6042 family protein [Nocardia sp. NRRL S-836]
MTTSRGDTSSTIRSRRTSSDCSNRTATPRLRSCGSACSAWRELGVDVDTARARLSVLVREPDLSADRAPEQVAEHAVIEISVDWAVFTETHIGITAGPYEDS